MGITGDEKIDEAIAVVVAPGSAGHEAAALDARLFGDVLELAVAQAVVESAAAKPGDEQVELAVVIVICNGHPHAPTAAGQAGIFGDVLESAVRLLVIEGDERVAAGAEALDRGAVNEDDVQAAIVIAIEEPGAAAGRVDDVVRLGSSDMDGGEADVFGDVFEGGDGREATAIRLGLCSAGLCNGRRDADRLRPGGLGGDKPRSHQG